jgi:hypothetical protein
MEVQWAKDIMNNSDRDMAASEQVKRYLAYWFQLGKPLVVEPDQRTILPQPIIVGNRYSPEFESLWQQLLALGGQGCYLEGTVQSIADLLSSTWEISDCARCGMPVPIISLGVSSAPCPCFDLPTWPNSDLPQPRLPVDERSRLGQIRDRLRPG